MIIEDYFTLCKLHQSNYDINVTSKNITINLLKRLNS